jgi:hypothetical protein
MSRSTRTLKPVIEYSLFKDGSLATFRKTWTPLFFLGFIEKKLIILWASPYPLWASPYPRPHIPCFLGGFKVREGVAFYNADFDPKKSDIGLKNAYKCIPFA